jgi:hypothetical protein
MFMTRPLFVTLSWFLHPCSEPPLSRLRTNLPIFFLCLNFFCNSRYNYRKYFGESKILRLTYSYKNISFFQNWSVTRTIQRASRFLGQGRFLEETLTVLWKSRRSHGQVMLNLIKPGGLNLSRSRLSISTLAESWSWQWRKSQHFQKASLDDRDISILSRWPNPVLLSQDQDLSRLVKTFVIICNFLWISGFFFLIST